MRQTILFIAALWSVAPASAQLKITPFISCVDFDPAANTNTVYFGYESFEQSIIQINVGGDNRFLPPPSNRQQPTLFFPGYHEKAFRVTLPANQALLFIFNGGGFAYNIGAPIPSCDAGTQSPSLPAAVQFVPYFQKLGATGAKATLSWQPATPLPAGLTLSADGTLLGTPTVPGNYRVSLLASDGISSSTRTYNLSIASGLTINDALSTRAPGFAPQFRVVTQPGVNNTAIASCALNEFVVTGGGGCVVPSQNTIQGRIASSQITGNGWAVTSSGGTATAMAVCSLN